VMAHYTGKLVPAILLAGVFASARMLTHGGSVSTRSRDRQEADRSRKLAYEMTGIAY
jgi:hypothetical protein